MVIATPDVSLSAALEQMPQLNIELAPVVILFRDSNKMISHLRVSFPRKRESTVLTFFWTPAPVSTGVTTLRGSDKE